MKQKWKQKRRSPGGRNDGKMRTKMRMKGVRIREVRTKLRQGKRMGKTKAKIRTRRVRRKGKRSYPKVVLVLVAIAVVERKVRGRRDLMVEQEEVRNLSCIYNPNLYNSRRNPSLSFP